MSIVSYAQNFEDVMLWRALGHVPTGFYIDIGAQHPWIDSVSKAFYEKGWRGIHVEATPAYANLLRQDRPDETVIQAGVNDAPGTITFYEIPETGLSTGDVDIAQSHRTRDFAVQEITVPCVTLQDVFRHAQSKDIHWLKIDVEGMELQVLRSWGECKVLPWIVVIESTLPLTQTESYQRWESCLLDRSYTHVYFDGLNRYYLSPDHPELAAAFSSGPNVFDGFTLDGTASSPFCAHVNEKHRQAEQGLQQQLAQVHQEQINAKQGFDAALAKISNQQHATQEEALKLKADLAEEAVKHVALERALLAEIQTLQTQWHQAEQEAAQREQALRELASETYRQAQTQTQAHLHTLAQREQAFGQQLLELHTQMRHAQAEASQREHALQAQSAEALQQAQTQAQAHLHTLAQREQAFGQQMLELHTQMHNVQAEASQHERALQAQSAEALQQAQTHLHTLAQRERALQAQTAVEAQLRAEILLEQQTGLRLRQSLAEVQRRLATTHASRTWRLTAPLRTLASFIGSPATTNAANSHTPPHEIEEGVPPDATVPPVSESPSINVQHASIKPTMPSSAQTTTPPAPAIASTVDELLAWHDLHFIQCAYQTLLGRAPDPDGLGYYLGRLRTGFSKIQLVAQLRLSKEGKAHAAQLPGLDLAIQRHQQERYPLIGGLFRRLHGGEGNDPTERKLRAIENQLGFLNAESSRRFNQIEAALADLHHLVVQQTQSVVAARGTPLGVPNFSNITRIRPPEPDGLKQLSPRAREIYFQLETAAADHAGRAV